MEFSSPRLKFNQSWPIVTVCVIGFLMLWAVTLVGTSSSYISEISTGTFFIEDKDGSYELQEILDLPPSQWSKEVNETLSYGLPNHPYWFRFTLPNEFDSDTSMPIKRLLEVDYTSLDSIELWFIDNGQIVAEYHEGDQKPFDHRALKSEKFLFSVPASDSDMDVIIRVNTDGILLLPMRIWEEQEYIVFNGEHNLALGLFFGFLAAMVLSNLFFFVTTGSMMFLTYSMYVVFIGLTLAAFHGIGYKYFWPDSIWLQNKSVVVFATLTLLMATIFSDQLLDAKTHSRVVHRLFKISVASLFITLIACLILPNSIYNQIFPFVVCLGASLVFFAAAYLAKKGVKLARFYLLAWSALLISGFLASFESANLIKLEYPAHYFIMFGAAIETFLLAFALAMAYGEQRDDQYKTQELALLEERLARKAQDEALKIKEETQEELEYKVQERTLELEITLRELSDTIRELEQQTLTDALTGIRNRKHFDKKYIAEVRRSRREQTELAIVMLDIDHFKLINDTHGHVVGDEVIKFVASTLQQNLKRTTDDACRYGGEEFALILPNTDLEGASLVAERLREIVHQQTIKLGDIAVNVTISAGVCSSVIMPNEDESSLLECADKALYEAKHNGRNRVASRRI